ncbi:MAG: ABC transporter ATP-binding protein [Oscillospiraceae bacterium]|jgi:ABC-2 type transport system ATP-binding protein|nr:ABC transporter ATP-binding protein [Oscillospiraceae bacterium]
MIKVSALNKRFEHVTALDNLSINVKKGSIYGLIGVNGSGKTTALKAITGVLRPDSGEITMDDLDVYENVRVKQRIGFIPDDLFFFGSYNMKECAGFYSRIFPNWSKEKYRTMAEQFGLSERRKLIRFSKGMQKQAAFILTMSSNPDWLILDEPIDGLDPLVRKLVWKHIVADVAERQMTVLVSSHNLREMEGICDSIGIVNSGKMLLERDLDELRSDIHKVQVAFGNAGDKLNNEKLEGFEILHIEEHGSIQQMIVRGAKEQVETIVRSRNPLIFDLIPLSLEEVFIYELGGGNNELGKLLF